MPSREAELKTQLDPQLAAALTRHRELLSELGQPGAGLGEQRQHFLDARAWWNEGGPRLEVDFDGAVPLPGGHRLRAAIYAAEASAGPRPAYVYLHGGGFRFGSPRSNDRQLRELASAWGGVVVSLDYAHLPEAAFPVAVEQTVAALHWLHAHGAAWGTSPERIALGGMSAGANIAMGAAVQLGLSRCTFLRALACIVGVFDGDLETASMREYGEWSLLPNRSSASAMLAEYVGESAQRSDPRFFTAGADLSCLPPLFLAAAEVDVFRDSSVLLAERAERAGATVELEVYPGVSHLFWGYSRMVDTSHSCTRAIASFLHARFAAEGAGHDACPVAD